MKELSNVQKAVRFFSMLAFATGFAWQGHAQALSLIFTNKPGGYLQFNATNGTIQFGNGNVATQWTITSETGGSRAVGLMGSWTGGPFFYAPTIMSGPVQSDTFTGPLGNLVIFDGGNLTGSVNSLTVSTVLQSSGVYSGELMLNVTGLSYGGTNPDFQTLVAAQTAIVDFQFTSDMSLTQLSENMGPYQFSYSGSVSVVPEPGALALSILGGLGILFRRRLAVA